jgi:hypothetical protein
MSASKPTEGEMKDLITLILPRVIVEALDNPDGEFYNGEIMDQAIEQALKNKISNEIEILKKELDASRQICESYRIRLINFVNGETSANIPS